MDYSKFPLSDSGPSKALPKKVFDTLRITLTQRLVMKIGGLEAGPISTNGHLYILSQGIEILTRLQKEENKKCPPIKM